MSKLNQAGIDLIKSFESCSLKAYPDPATKGAPWTIGWGHTGPEVKPNSVWSQALCDEVFKRDCDSFAHHMIEHLMLPSSVNDNQFSAMLSFAYNLGMHTLEDVIDDVGLEGFADKIQEYVYAGPKGKKKVMKGLVIRRVQEAILFNTPPKGGNNVKIGGNFSLSNRRYL